MMTGLALAVCDRELAPGEGAPDWVHLLPDGKMTGRDGREFDLADPAALVLAFQSSGVDLPVDYEHATENPDAKARGPIPAAGWIAELKAKTDGLWGRVKWTETAREMIGRKEYRYLSPSFLFHPKTRQIVKLNGAGLVHNPNLYLTALASQDSTMQPTEAPKTDTAAAPDLAAALAKLLGLPSETPPAELLAKLTAKIMAEPDPAKYMPVTAVQAMLQDRSLERSTASDARAIDKVNAAFKQGYIHGGMKEWATALCRSDEAAFDTFLEKSGPVFAQLFTTSHTRGIPPAAAEPAETSAVAAAICAQLGLKPDALKA